MRNLLAVEHFKEFLLRTTFVTFVMSVLVTNIGINPTTVEPNFSAWTENQNTIGALRPDRNFATWVHLPRLVIGSIDRIFSQYPQENWPQNFNLWQICCEQDAYGILSTLIFHRIVENAVDYRARIYVSLYSFMPCSSLNHDRSTGLYLSVINCDTLMHRQMLRS